MRRAPEVSKVKRPGDSKLWPSLFQLVDRTEPLLAEQANWIVSPRTVVISERRGKKPSESEIK